MDLPGNSLPETDRGVWRSVVGGPWTQFFRYRPGTWCGDVSGCGAEHGDYSQEIAAVPNGTVATDLYVGAVNLYRCPLVDGSNSANCSGGAWLNLSHAYGCSEMAKMHPDQHAVQFAVVAGKAVGYFANDGGVYRVLDGFMGLGSGLNGSCTGTNQFESLKRNARSDDVSSFPLHRIRQTAELCSQVPREMGFQLQVKRGHKQRGSMRFPATADTLRSRRVQ